MSLCTQNAWCVRIDGHRGGCDGTEAVAAYLDQAEWRADMLAEMRRLNASLAALPPVLNAIAGGVMAGVGSAFTGPQGEPLTLADFADDMRKNLCPHCGAVQCDDTCPRRTG